MDKFQIKFIIMVCKTQLCDIDGDDDACDQTVVLIYVATYV